MNVRFFNELQVAQKLGISVSTLRAHRHQRKGLPYHKLGSRVLYREDDLDSYLARRRVTFDKEA